MRGATDPDHSYQFRVTQLPHQFSNLNVNSLDMNIEVPILPTGRFLVFERQQFQNNIFLLLNIICTMKEHNMVLELMKSLFD